jgi:hypothetical protein
MNPENSNLYPSGEKPAESSTSVGNSTADENSASVNTTEDTTSATPAENATPTTSAADEYVPSVQELAMTSDMTDGKVKVKLDKKVIAVIVSVAVLIIAAAGVGIWAISKSKSSNHDGVSGSNSAQRSKDGSSTAKKTEASADDGLIDPDQDEAYAKKKNDYTANPEEYVNNFNLDVASWEDFGNFTYLLFSDTNNIEGENFKDNVLQDPDEAVKRLDALEEKLGSGNESLEKLFTLYRAHLYLIANNPDVAKIYLDQVDENSLTKNLKKLYYELAAKYYGLAEDYDKSQEYYDKYNSAE